MKIIFLLSLFLFFYFLPLVAQQEPVTQDPAAKEILDRIAAKAKQMKSIQADFSILVEDKKENTKNYLHRKSADEKGEIQNLHQRKCRLF